MNLRGNSRGNLFASQGRLSGSSQLRSVGTQDSQAGRLSRVSAGQKQLQGGPSGSSPLRSDGSHVS
jgi:hypothetical protein